jgi:hypothetical protein
VLKKLLPILLALIGSGAGIAVGLALRSGPEAPANPCGEMPGPAAEAHPEPADLHRDYLKLSNQFVVPVVADGKTRGLVVISLSLEIEPGSTEKIYEREPKLQDAFLRVMFDHANSGGFDGEFTANGNMAPLRAGLLQAARLVLGPIVSDVLIVSIIRQDG